jgi:2-polyprenyl-3-methyl-5-hydroxy-6-metoxy-1,4-benzoquinol methylase
MDPAANLIPISKHKGHEAHVAFWDKNIAGQLKTKHDFDVIIAQNVLAHIPIPVEFLLAVRLACNEHTRVFIQILQMDMFFKGEFDTVYHEHISFFQYIQCYP